MNRFLASFYCSIVFSAFGLCQISGQVSGTASASTIASSQPGFHGRMGFPAAHFTPQAITGAPYSAEEVDEEVQTLADGTHIEHANPGEKIYRDSMGRTRTERKPFHGPLGRHRDLPEGPTGVEITIIEINDPVAHVRYIFSLDEPVAHRQELPADNQRNPAARSRPGHAVIGRGEGTTGSAGGINQAGMTSAATVPAVTVPAAQALPARHHAADNENLPHTTFEKLGTQVIEGLTVEGTLQTTTWPVGSMGNDRPITRTTEFWRSPDLETSILTKSNDPRSGEHTHKLINISRAEPDASLFEPPPGYTVKDEPGEFKIEWGRGR